MQYSPQIFNHLRKAISTQEKKGQFRKFNIYFMCSLSLALSLSPAHSRRLLPSQMAPASAALHAPTTSSPFPAGAGGRSRPQWGRPPAYQAPLPPVATRVVPRRLLLPAAAGIWDFISGGAGGAAAASLAVRRGMQLFCQVFNGRFYFLSLFTFYNYRGAPGRGWG